MVDFALIRKRTKRLSTFMALSGSACNHSQAHRAARVRTGGRRLQEGAGAYHQRRHGRGRREEEDLRAQRREGGVNSERVGSCRAIESQ